MLLRKCDATFAAYVPGFAKDSASMDRDRLLACEGCSNLFEIRVAVSLSSVVVAVVVQELFLVHAYAYVRKMGDAKVDATTNNLLF